MTTASRAPANARVLLIHNAYQQRGGEDAVVESELALLRSRGHEVQIYARHNDELRGSNVLTAGAQALWSTRSHRDVLALCRDWRPDIVHAHNTFPLVSPSVYWAAAKAGVPVVQTLHNFRLLCPQALMLRDNRVCEDCLGRVPWRAVAHRCYRGSAPQSAVAAGMVQLHRTIGTWRHKVARYVALNEFCREKFILGGLPAERVSVKPNFVDLTAPDPQPRSGLLFVGRLAVEKGIDTLAAAMRMQPPGCRLRVIGDGPLAGVLNGISGLQALGTRPAGEVIVEMARSIALVLPSIWYENYPRTVVEAFACSTPVIASRIGALATLVEDGATGLLFDPGDAQGLARLLQWAQENPEAMLKMGQNARRFYVRELTADANYAQLMQIYGMARG